ncbi:MAG: hypothetical protein P8X65_08385 [Syntrophobacterales bacterium]
MHPVIFGARAAGSAVAEVLTTRDRGPGLALGQDSPLAEIT